MENIYCVLLSVLLYGSGLVSGDCTNSLGPNLIWTVTDNAGGKIKDVSDCDELISEFPHFCLITESERLPWQLATGGENGVCCERCGDISCLDVIAASNLYRLDGKFFDTCQEVMTKYPVECKVAGRPFGRCCQTCKTIDYSCVDTLRNFRIGGGRSQRCAEYIDANPCRCEEEDIREQCCESCAGFNNQCACRDTLDSSEAAILNIIETRNGVPTELEVRVDNCKDLVEKYPNFCRETSFSTERGQCCISCQGVDVNCANSIGWKVGSVRVKKQGRCRNCTCQQLMDKGLAFIKKACKKNVKSNIPQDTRRARDACCLMCRNLGF